MIAAEQADVVVMCLGLDATIEGEEGDAGNEYASGDKPSLRLPGLQQELLEKITAIGKPVILVVLAGSAMDLRADKNVDAIIDAWYPGARGGRAVAELIFGDYSPSGKLPVTFYEDETELPEFTDYSMSNRTYRYSKAKALYPFGYGLKYTDIEYSGETLDRSCASVGDEITISAQVSNNGTYDVNEIVQAYIKHVDALDYEPGFQLKGIQVLRLEAGETAHAEIKLDNRAFGIITEEGKCVLRPGKYQISIGAGQPDARTQELYGYRTEVLELEISGTETEIEF